MGRGLRHAAAVLAMICLTTGFTGLSGLIWTGAQQQRVYDDLIRQTKRESVLLSRTKNRGRKWKCTENEGFSGGITGTKAGTGQRW